MSKSKVLGRITLFVNDKKGRLNAPDYNGKLIQEDGTYIIDLWKEPANTAVGYVLKGTLSEMWKKEDGEEG